jgi:hypothetical protein
MSDVRQKAKDLLKLALEGSTEGERNAATNRLLKLMSEYDLLSAGGKPINVASTILEKIAGLDMDEVASGVERFASSVERVMAAGKRMSRGVGVGEARERRRRSRR